MCRKFYILSFNCLCSLLLLIVPLLMSMESDAQTISDNDVEITILENSTGKPVQFAHVGWQALNNEEISGFVVTNNQGKFRIDPPLIGPVVISVSCVGFKSLTDTINVHKETAITLEEDVLNLEQIVVTGTRTPKRLADVPVQTTVIPGVDIKKAGAVSPLEVLQDNVPGLVSTGNAMGNNLRIKGLNSRYILFLVDGERLVSEGSGGNINLDQIDFNTIDRIEIVNGAASALYGSNAVGAVINLITKKPVHRFEGGMNTSHQTNNTNRLQLNIGGNHDKTTLAANIFRNTTDGYDIAEGASSNPHTDYGTNLRIGYNLSERISTNVKSRLFQHEVFNFPGSMNVKHRLERKVTLGGNTTVVSKNNRNNAVASLNFDKFFKYDVMERKDDLLQKRNDITYISGRIVNNYASGEKWETVFGTEYNYEEISTDSSKILGPRPDSKSVSDGNAFLQLQYTLPKDIDIVIGSRYTYNEQFGSAFSPKLSLMYKAGRFVFRGGSGTAFRAPALQELYYNFNHNGSFWVYGNPDLIPENGLYNSLAVEYTKGTLNMSASGYHNQIRNKITSYRVMSDLGQPDRYYRNVSSSTLKGVDLNISYVWLRQFVLKSTYSYSDARDNNTGLQLTSNVKHSATFAFTWNGEVMDSPFSFQFSGRVTSPILFEYIETDEQGIDEVIKNSSNPYSIWKTTLIKPVRINEHLLEFTFKCDNVFNFSDIYYTNPGRQYLVGLRYKFR